MSPEPLTVHILFGRNAMTTQIPHFINGQRTTAGSTRTADVLNPSTGEVQAQVVLASAADVDAAVSGAAEAQKEWAAYNPQRRARVLMKFIELVHQNANELAELLSLEHGKTVADSHGDIQRGLEVIEFAVGIPHLLKGEFTEGAGTGIDVYSIRQPLGVVAGITPFNFPAMIPLWKAGPALACGNAFVLKPSERDPSVPLRLAELFIEAGLPAGVFQVVQGDKEAVDAILEHPEIKAVGFVGSSDIAQYIYSGAAAHGKRAQCFGGAKNHMIVMPDADLDQAVDALIGAGYGSAGERCMAISVAVPVGEETANRLRNRLVERINQLRVGHSLDPKADYGPLVTGAALERVRDYIGQGVAAGAELVVDGRERASNELTFGDASLEKGYFIGPTLFDNVTTDMSIYTDEIFGPVLCIVRAHDYEEALKLPSEHEYGNGVAIFTRDGDAARDFVSRVQVGMVGVNVPIPVPVAYHTFGGWKRSGFGDLNQHGPHSILFYTKTKTVTERWPSGIKDGAEFVIPTMK
ncbi:methylmalonate-semialdehyde dehydrogenase [Mycolicibacterium fortuitum subsp. acetamidolyticum]|nr:methylmalonate-semialdehyde dehydrogenase [Mycolicibacterium fortuitum subsp. acetamidolyticum]